MESTKQAQLPPELLQALLAHADATGNDVQVLVFTTGTVTQIRKDVTIPPPASEASRLRTIAIAAAALLAAAMVVLQVWSLSVQQQQHDDLRAFSHEFNQHVEEWEWAQRQAAEQAAREGK